MQMQQVQGVATVVFSREADTIVMYHQTEVVKFSYDRIVLNSGGWRTATTKARMNQASNQYNLGYLVYQKRGAWFVKLADGTVLDFKDGMEIKRA